MRLIHLLASLAIFAYSALATGLIVVRLSDTGKGGAGKEPQILLVKNLCGQRTLPFVFDNDTIVSVLSPFYGFKNVNFDNISAQGGAVELHDLQNPDPLRYQTVMVEQLPDPSSNNFASNWVSLQSLLAHLDDGQSDAAYDRSVKSLPSITNNWGGLIAAHYLGRTDIAFKDPRPRFFTYVRRVNAGFYDVLLALRKGVGYTLIPIDMERDIEAVLNIAAKDVTRMDKTIGGVKIRFYASKVSGDTVKRVKNIKFDWVLAKKFQSNQDIYVATRDLPSRPEFKEVLAALEAGSP